jgi:hypothetical protein
MPWESVVYRRDKLYEQVWLEPARSVARHYGISDVALGKICRKLEVPLPGRGHWARKAAGQEIPRALLPELKKGQPAQLQSARYVEPSTTQSFGEDTNERILREADPAHKIVVPETLIDPHPLVRSSAPILRRAKFGERPMAAERCLDISATGDALNRALRVVDSLIKALEARGYEVDVTEPKAADGDPYRSNRGTPSRTGVRIGDSFVGFAIDEKSDVFEPPPPPPGRYNYGPRYEHRPNGKLVLAIPERQYSGQRQRWSDGKRQRLEDQLNDFVAALIATAEQQRLKAIQAEKDRQRRIAAEREREAAARQHAAIAVLARDLHRRMSAWRTAQDTRAFVDLLKQWSAADAVDTDPRFTDWLYLAERRIQVLEKRARTDLLDRQHNLAYSSPLRQRFAWAGEASTADLVNVVLFPYRQRPDDPDETPA